MSYFDFRTFLKPFKILEVLRNVIKVTVHHRDSCYIQHILFYYLKTAVAILWSFPRPRSRLKYCSDRIEFPDMCLLSTFAGRCLWIIIDLCCISELCVNHRGEFVSSQPTYNLHYLMVIALNFFVLRRLSGASFLDLEYWFKLG